MLVLDSALQVPALALPPRILAVHGPWDAATVAATAAATAAAVVAATAAVPSAGAGADADVGAGAGADVRVAASSPETRDLEVAAQNAVHHGSIEATNAAVAIIIKMIDNIEQNPNDAAKRKFKATPGGAMDALLLAMGFKFSGMSSDNKNRYTADRLEDVQFSLTVVRGALDSSRPYFRHAAASSSSS